jgi:hypothetical protein
MGGGLQALLSLGSFWLSYFFSTASDGFLLRMYMAAAKITIMAKTTPGAVQLVLAAGGALVELVAGAIVAGAIVVALVALDTG